MTNEREDRLRCFLEEKGASYHEDVLSHFHSFPEIQQRHAPALSILYRGLLHISGPDTIKFLQGQLTCNIEHLLPTQQLNGSACTPKGRMYSNFTLLNTGNDQFLMAMHSGLLEHTKTVLNKYAVFFKTDIEVNNDYICLGLSGVNIGSLIKELFSTIPETHSAQQVEDNIWLLPVNGLTERFELWLPFEKLNLWWDRLTTHFKPVNSQVWRLLDIEAVTPSLTPASLEKYIPQHLNQPSLKAVSFRKGCYTGQEIVARMQNLGQLKSRCYRLTTSESVQLEAGTKLLNGEGKNIGEVFDCVPSIDTRGSEILAVIRVDAADDNDVLTEKGLKLDCYALPYEVNAKEELKF